MQPSYEEGYSTTICEAGILGKAIIGTTTSGGIYEQLTDKETGLFAEPTPEGLAEAIKYIADNPAFKEKLEKNVKTVDFNHKNEIDKLLKLTY